MELTICDRISETRLNSLMRGKENHTTMVPYVRFFVCFCFLLLKFYETRNNVVKNVFKYTVAKETFNLIIQISCNAGD